MYWVATPSMETCRFVKSEIRLFAIPTSTKPVVPDGPVTVKLSWLLVESNKSADTVEFEVTENTFWFEYDANARVIIWLVPLM